jgi:exonuclease VII large subunit
MPVEDEKWVATLQGMFAKQSEELDQKLHEMQTDMQAEIHSAIRAESARSAALLDEVKESLEREIQALSEKMDRRFEQVDRRFDQVNSRLTRVDVIWKVARDWGSGVDNHDADADKVIAELVRQVTDLQERMARIEKKQ